MFKLLNRKNSGKRGFTLIELLVVIAIIGILASIVLASLNSARRKSRDVRRIADLGQIRVANELYFDSNPTVGYSATVAGLNAAGSCGTQVCMSTLPIQPAGVTGAGAVYADYCVVTVGGVNTSYGIHTALEDAANRPASATTLPCGAFTCTAATANYCVSN